MKQFLQVTTRNKVTLMSNNCSKKSSSTIFHLNNKTKKSSLFVPSAIITTILLVKTASIFISKNKTELSIQSATTTEVLNSDCVRYLHNKDTGRTVCIIGTVHTAPEAVQLVKRIIRNFQPNTVALELDRKRIGYSLSTSFRNTKEVTSTLSSNIITDTSLVRQRKLIKQPVVDLTVTKSRTNALNSLGKPLSHVFRSLDSVGFTSGSEVKAAVKEAFQLGATIVLADRDIDVTMRRLSEAIKATESDRFAAMVVGISHHLLNCHQESINTKTCTVLVANLHTKQRTREGTLSPVSPQELLSTSLDRALADPVFASQLAEVMCREVPAIHQALISERDLHMADCVLQSSGPRTCWS